MAAGAAARDQHLLLHRKIIRSAIPPVALFGIHANVFS
jgi:hypothetical protein